jgi:hypothetical protein
LCASCLRRGLRGESWEGFEDGEWWECAAPSDTPEPEPVPVPEREVVAARNNGIGERSYLLYTVSIDSESRRMRDELAGVCVVAAVTLLVP